jgi:Cu2+-exporting ATPase
MQEAPIHDTRMENYAAKLANKAVVPTLLLGLGVFALTRNLARAASVLTLDFATGVRVSVPTTVLAALTHAARRGVLIRSGRALEKLAEVDIIVFDKTGTLTLGEVAVVNIETVHPEISCERLLSLAASAEQRLTHPVAEAIVRYALQQEIEILPRGEWDYEVGLGVSAIIDGQSVLVGSDRFLQSSGIQITKQHQPGSRIYVASNGEFLGSIEYSDQLRPESQEVIAQLQAKNLDIHMLSGDNRHTAASVASVLGIPPTHTHAEAFPEQKAEIVRQLHTAGKTVAFVGDGINDSPALAYADVSVSFASGSEIARETADVVLMENDLLSLVEAIAIANFAKQIIYENTGIVVAPNLTALMIAATVGLSPLAATVVNNGSSVVAGLNGLRPILMGHQEKSNSK